MKRFTPFLAILLCTSFNFIVSMEKKENEDPRTMVGKIVDFILFKKTRGETKSDLAGKDISEIKQSLFCRWGEIETIHHALTERSHAYHRFNTESFLPDEVFSFSQRIGLSKSEDEFDRLLKFYPDFVFYVKKGNFTQELQEQCHLPLTAKNHHTACVDTLNRIKIFIERQHEQAVHRFALTYLIKKEGAVCGRTTYRMTSDQYIFWFYVSNPSKFLFNENNIKSGCAILKQRLREMF